MSTFAEQVAALESNARPRRPDSLLSLEDWEEVHKARQRNVKWSKLFALTTYASEKSFQIAYYRWLKRRGKK